MDTINPERRANQITVEFKQDGQIVGLMTTDPKEFKTGSKGYYAMGKITIGEKRYQVQVQLVEIGSKPKADGEEVDPVSLAEMRRGVAHKFVGNPAR